MSDLIVIAGTRPEVVKLAPLVKALRASKIQCKFILSGQHPDLAGDVLPSLNLEEDEKLIGVGRNNTLELMEAKLTESIGYRLRKSKAKNILVLGDTSTALVVSRVAFLTGKKLFHVEAGLRTTNRFSPFPEEQNRRTISQYADVHLAPSEQARQNLLREGLADDRIYVVGSTFIEAFQDVREIGKSADFFLSNNKDGQWDFVVYSKIRKSEKKEPSIPVKTVLFTSHRRENVPQGINAVCDLALRLTQEQSTYFKKSQVPHIVIWPVHPNPEVDDIIRHKLKHKSRVKLTRSLRYHEMAWLMDHVDAIVTDSAGVMEEASILGIPTVVARNETERPELFEGSKTLFLAPPHLEGLTSALDKALRSKKNPINPAEHLYGGSPASRRIVSILEHELVS